MAILVPVTSLTGMILAPVFIRLAFGVIRKRREHRVAVGAGNHDDLESAIRAHGNFAEYVPIGLILMLTAEINGVPWWFVSMAGLMLVVGRLIHASAITTANLKKRVTGMQLTFGAIAAGVAANAYAMLKALFP